MPAFNLIIPFYRNSAMLRRQCQEWAAYPVKGIKITVVDDGSPEPALPIIMENTTEELRNRIRVFRVTVDIPWNREGARNLGSQQTDDQWLVHVDIDHILPAPAAVALLAFQPRPGHWYRFPRWRVGRADETRRKDEIADGVEFGEIKPHIDSYLISRMHYWQVGGYDEDYSGTLGGGSEFLRRVQSTIAAPYIFPPDIHLHVYTRDKIKDASDWSLSRDTARGKEITRRKDAKHGPGKSRPERPIRFPWVREL